jgi:hypothetical protein
MPTLVDEISDLKTQAKNRRDLKRYERAVSILNEAIGLAERSLEIQELRRRLAEELADCYGLLGGVQRRWALDPNYRDERALHLRESIRAYDNAWKYESGDYGVVNSYGMLNRLISRLLYDKDSLFVDAVTSFGNDVAPLNVRAKLEKAREAIEAQLVQARRDDCWAAADFALVTVLLEKADPISAYASFVSTSPPAYAYKSVVDVLRPLAELEWRVAPALKDAIAYVEERFARLQLV